MFGKNRKKQSDLDEPITAVLNELNEHGTNAPETDDLITRLERLSALRDTERGGRVSPDTLAIVAGNLLGILFILKFEQTNVMVSKAVGMILRTKSNHHS